MLLRSVELLLRFCEVPLNPARFARTANLNYSFSGGAPPRKGEGAPWKQVIDHVNGLSAVQHYL